MGQQQPGIYHTGNHESINSAQGKDVISGFMKALTSGADPALVREAHEAYVQSQMI